LSNYDPNLWEQIGAASEAALSPTLQYSSVTNNVRRSTWQNGNDMTRFSLERPRAPLVGIRAVQYSLLVETYDRGARLVSFVNNPELRDKQLPPDKCLPYVAFTYVPEQGMIDEPQGSNVTRLDLYPGAYDVATKQALSLLDFLDCAMYGRTEYH
jgi:hypothetical protein